MNHDEKVLKEARDIAVSTYVKSKYPELNHYKYTITPKQLNDLATKYNMSVERLDALILSTSNLRVDNSTNTWLMD